jgi:glycosyltransferase involved in cell wall biosynthesis
MSTREMSETGPSLSVVVISYNMGRELRRTLYSLSVAMQKGIDQSRYEIIVVDNGSTDGFDADGLICFDADIRATRIADGLPSPASAINMGIRHARGNIIGAMIDGARIASPGLLRNALLAARLHHRPVISTLGFHLGHERQDVSIKKGYNQDIEDKLLEEVDWKADGYQLFKISVFAGSSAGGWFLPISESNALFLHRDMWTELGGFDESFISAGGGLVNLDTYLRACELPDSQLIVLLGEGTFHQVHKGIATNALISPIEEFHTEYVRLRGKPFAQPVAKPWYFGTAPPQTLSMIEESAHMAHEKSYAGYHPPGRGRGLLRRSLAAVARTLRASPTN